MSQSEWRRRSILTGAGLALAALASPLPAYAAAVSRASAAKLPKPIGPRFNVKEFGAIGDGKTKDTLAIQQALTVARFWAGARVNVPAGQFLIGVIMIGSNTQLILDEGAVLQGSPDKADYPLSQVRWEGRFRKGYLGLICARNAENIAISGKGRIIGAPSFTVRVEAGTGFRNPTLMEFINCQGVDVRDCYTEQNAMWSIHPINCQNISFHNMTINGGADGIDIDSCKGVIIDNCTFHTADDCISLKSGRGEEGYTLMQTTENVRVSNCSFIDTAHACIGIGSESSGGIRGAVFEHCKFVGARTYAIYIKTKVGRGAFVEDLTFDDLDVSGATGGFLNIDNITVGNQDEFPVPGDAGLALLRNFTFNNIRVTDVPNLVKATNIHPAKPMDGFVLSNISGTCGKGISLTNTRHAELKNIRVTGFTGSLVSTNNVTGTGLAGAASIPQPTLPAPIPAPARPYILGDLQPVP